MPAHRLPVAKAKVTGASSRNPKRHSKRADPAVGVLGGAPTHLEKFAKRAWERFRSELPWLTSSDRALLEVACIIRSEMLQGGVVGIQKLNTYQAVLSKLGATPTDRSKVNVPDEEEAPDEFFGNC
jgi:phage terminase small subunit